MLQTRLLLTINVSLDKAYKVIHNIAIAYKIYNY